MKTVLLRAMTLALAAALCAPPAALAQPAAAAQPAPAQLTAEQWREDLRFMAAEMERRHKNLFHTVSEAEFRAAVDDLDRRIPTLQRNEIVVGMMRIAAMVGDGHTRVDPRKDPNFLFPSLPLKLYLFEDGLYIRAAAPAHAELVGARIEAIGGVPVEEAIKRVVPLASVDNEIGTRHFVPLYLNMPDILHALGLSKDRGSATLKLSKGRRTWTARVAAGEVDPVWPPDTDISLVTPEGWVDARRTPRPPLWLEAPLDYHRMVALDGGKALYVQLNMVTGIKGQTLAQFAEKIGGHVQTHNPSRVILDLRLNLGGNGYLGRPLVSELIRAEDEDTRLFVLTGRGTFSASQFLLDDLSRLSKAVLVGEPAASKPSSYGDSYRMPMPNSGISVRSSIVWWQEGQNQAPWTWVQVAAPYSFADYRAGRDPALEAALAYTPPPPLVTQLSAAAKAGGSPAVLKALEAWRSDPVNRYADIARTSMIGAELLRHEHPQEALAAAQMLAREHPLNVDSWVVLAFLAETAKEKGLAIRAGERALQLDPNNRVIRSFLERLRAL